MNTRITTALLVLSLVPLMSAATCGKADPVKGTAEPGSMMDDAVSQARSKDGCALKTAAPYTLSMKGAQLGQLESALKSGQLVFVKYKCQGDDQGLVILEGCAPLIDDGAMSGEYTTFFSGGVIEETKTFSGKDALQGNFRNLYAKVEAKVEQSVQMGLDLRLLGSMTTTINAAYREALEPNACAEATHFIKGAEVGAFQMSSNTSQALQASLEVTMAGGASTDMSRARTEGLAAGDWDACKAESDPEIAFELGCSVPVQLQLLPIRPGAPPGGVAVAEGNDVGAAPDCPIPDQVFANGQCVSKEDAAGGYICDASKRDQEALDDCAKQCQKGNDTSCQLLARLHRGEDSPQLNYQRSLDLLQRACPLVTPDASSCTDLGLIYLQGAPPFSKPEPTQALSVFKRACYPGEALRGDGRGCYQLGMAYLNSVGMRQSDRAKAVESFERSCNLGFADGCARVGYVNYLNYLEDPASFDRRYRRAQEELRQRVEGARKALEAKRAELEAKAAAEAKAADGAKDADGADKKAEAQDKGAADEPAEAQEATATPEQEGDPTKKVRKRREQSAFEALVLSRLQLACHGGSPEGCFYLGQVYEKGAGLPQARPEKANSYYRWGCDMNNTQSCLRYGELFYDGVAFESKPNIPDAIESYRKACFGQDDPWNKDTDAFQLPDSVDDLKTLIAASGFSLGDDDPPEEAADGEESVLTREMKRLQGMMRNAEACNALGRLYITNAVSQVSDVSEETQQSRAKLLFLASCLGGSPEGCNDIGRIFLARSSFQPENFYGANLTGFLEQINKIGEDGYFQMVDTIFTIACDNMRSSGACYSIAMEVYQPLIVAIRDGIVYESSEEFGDVAQQREIIEQGVESFEGERNSYLERACQMGTGRGAERACVDMLVFRRAERDEDDFPEFDTDEFEDIQEFLPSVAEVSKMKEVCVRKKYTKACFELSLIYYLAAVEGRLKELSREALLETRKTIARDAFPMMEAGCGHIGKLPRQADYSPQERNLDALISCILMAYMYEQGIGVEVSGDEAFRIFRRLCREHKAPVACLEVAGRYMPTELTGLKNTGVKEDPIRAYKYLEDAYRNELQYEDFFNASASEQASLLIEKMEMRYLEDYCAQKQASPIEHLRACAVVANEYRRTEVNEDLQARERKAFEAKRNQFNRKACDLGDPDACFHVAQATLDNPRARGKAVEQAAKDLSYACLPSMEQRIPEEVAKAIGDIDELSVMEACHTLGMMYYTGYPANSRRPIIKKDAEKAYFFLDESCDPDRGRYKGCTEVGTISEYGLDNYTDVADAVEYYKIGCRRGEARSCHQLAGIYAQGLLGNGRDLRTAAVLYERACEAGHRPACQRGRRVRTLLKEDADAQ